MFHELFNIRRLLLVGEQRDDLSFGVIVGMHKLLPDIIRDLIDLMS